MAKKIYTKSELIDVLLVSRTTYYRYRETFDAYFKRFYVKAHSKKRTFYLLDDTDIHNLRLKMSKRIIQRNHNKH